MDNINERDSFCYNDSTSGATKYDDRNISVKEISLLQHLQRGISETTEESIANTKEITNLLSKLDLEVETLPKDIKEKLEKLSSILKAEKLFEFDETALCVARKRRVIEEKKQEREERQMSLMHDKLLRNCTKLFTQLDHLQDEVKSLENIVTTNEEEKDDLCHNEMYLSAKLQEYQQTVNKLETDLNNMQIDELYSEKILNKYKAYLEKTSELANLNQQLAQYYDLPPNLPQAKLMLENKKKEYENLEQMFLDNTK